MKYETIKQKLRTVGTIVGVAVVGLPLGYTIGSYLPTQKPFKRPTPIIRTYQDTDNNGLYDTLKTEYPTGGIETTILGGRNPLEVTAEKILQEQHTGFNEVIRLE